MKKEKQKLKFYTLTLADNNVLVGSVTNGYKNLEIFLIIYAYFHVQ